MVAWSSAVSSALGFRGTAGVIWRRAAPREPPMTETAFRNLLATAERVFAGNGPNGPNLIVEPAAGRVLNVERSGKDVVASLGPSQPRRLTTDEVVQLEQTVRPLTTRAIDYTPRTITAASEPTSRLLERAETPREVDNRIARERANQVSVQRFLNALPCSR
jgi:hypothetical protein